MYEGILDSLELKDDWMINDSIADGSCFFDSFRQCLYNLKGIVVTIHELRKKCKEYAEENNSVRWLIEEIAYNTNNITGETTFEDIDEYCQNIMSNDRWGNPETEGRILCETYNVKLLVIENHGDPQFIFTLVTEDGARQVQPNYNDINTIFIINDGANHFLPLLRKNTVYDTNIKRKRTSENCVVDEQPTKRQNSSLKSLDINLERCDSLLSKSNSIEIESSVADSNSIPDINDEQTAVNVTHNNILYEEIDISLKEEENHSDSIINDYSHIAEVCNDEQTNAGSPDVKSDSANSSINIDSNDPQQNQKYIVFDSVINGHNHVAEVGKDEQCNADSADVKSDSANSGINNDSHDPQQNHKYIVFDKFTILKELEISYRIAERFNKSNDIIFCRKSELKLFHRILKIYKTIWVMEKFVHNEFSSAIGKTIFIQHYIEKYFQAFTNSVAWVDCENFEKIHHKMQKINTIFENGILLTVFDNIYSDTVVSYLHNCLSDYKGIYRIIITNFLNPSKMKPKAFRINELRIRDACKFVKKILNISKRIKMYDKSIENFVIKLRRHPLALKLSLSFIEKQLIQGKFTFDDFNRLYDKQHDLDESEIKALFSENAFPIFLVIHKVMTIVIKEIKSDKCNGDIALEALYYLSLLPKDNIKLDYLENQLHTRPKMAIKLLQDFSIIRIKKDYNSVVYIPKILQYNAKYILAKMLNK